MSTSVTVSILEQRRGRLELRREGLMSTHPASKAHAVALRWEIERLDRELDRLESRIEAAR